MFPSRIAKNELGKLHLLTLRVLLLYHCSNNQPDGNRTSHRVGGGTAISVFFFPFYHKETFILFFSDMNKDTLVLWHVCKMARVMTCMTFERQSWRNRFM